MLFRAVLRGFYQGCARCRHAATDGADDGTGTAAADGDCDHGDPGGGCQPVAIRPGRAQHRGGGTRFWPTFIGILIGTWIGVKILSVIDETALMILVGIAVIAFALLQGSRFRFHLPDRLVKPVGLFFGCASGLIGGVSSFFGPMLITYLISIRGLTKKQFVSSISFLYVGAVVPWAITLYLFDILDQRLLVYSTFATLPVTLGLLIGQRLRGHISEARFQYLIIGILIVSGISMLWRAFH